MSYRAIRKYTVLCATQLAYRSICTKFLLFRLHIGTLLDSPHISLSAMTCFIVTFEVARPETSKRLIAAIQKYASTCQLTLSCWALVTEEKAGIVRDTLKRSLEPGDRIFVLRSGSAGAWSNAISKKHSEWLKENI